MGTGSGAFGGKGEESEITKNGGKEETGGFYFSAEKIKQLLAIEPQ